MQTKEEIPKKEKEEKNRQQQQQCHCQKKFWKDNINDDTSASVVEISSILGGEDISDSEPEVSAVVPVAEAPKQTNITDQIGLTGFQTKFPILVKSVN